MVSIRLGDAPRIENTGSTSWKPLRSSSGHALDDDDELDPSKVIRVQPWGGVVEATVFFERLN